jgi:hypothetical protein
MGEHNKHPLEEIELDVQSKQISINQGKVDTAQEDKKRKKREKKERRRAEEGEEGEEIGHGGEDGEGNEGSKGRLGESEKRNGKEEEEDC